MSKISGEQKKNLSELDIKFIESFDDDIGWLMLDWSDEEKELILSLEGKEKNEMITKISLSK